VIFTGVVHRSIGDHASRRTDDYGSAFAYYIGEHNLGTVVRSETRENWTTNEIAIWIWHVNYDRLYPHLDSLGV
jgi:protein associated with RNAse G/E